MKLYVFVPAAALLAVAAGCSRTNETFLPVSAVVTTSAPPAPVAVQEMDVAGLEKAIAGHKGKVVVVDFWADYCIPCKEEFPNLVRLHKELTGDGLVAVSVSVDDTDAKAKVLKFLQDQKAAFENFIIPQGVQEKYDFAGVPCVAVYGRDGKLVKLFNGDPPRPPYKYTDVEPLVRELLGKK